MALHRLFQLSSLLGSAVRVTLRRNIGISAVLFNRAKELDPVQKLFVDKIREYNVKSKSVLNNRAFFAKETAVDVSSVSAFYSPSSCSIFPSHLKCW